jgi:peptide subunit release factor 1 (eRF1)
MNQRLSSPGGTVLALSDLKKLAEMSTSERTFLSVYLAGPHSVTGLEKKCERMRHLLRTDGPEKDEREYFDDNVRVVTGYLDRYPLKSGALCIFSCHLLDVFRTIPLSVHVEDLIRIDASPFIRPLAELRDEHATAAVVVADNKKARIFVVSMAETGSEEVIRGNVKNHVKVGGWSQQRYERRRDNELHKYALEIVEALEKIGRSEEIDHILMVGSKETLRVVHDNMPHGLKDKAVEKAIDLSKGDPSINKDIMELFREEEPTTGLEHWEHIRAEYLRGGLVVIGLEEVLHMAKAQRIEHAIVDRTIRPPGMRCRNCHNLNIGLVKSCLVCASRSLYEVELLNEILDMVYLSGGTAYFTDPVRTLTDAGGIAAHLRY